MRAGQLRAMDVDQEAGEQARLLGSASDVPLMGVRGELRLTAFQVAASMIASCWPSKVSPLWAIFPNVDRVRGGSCRLWPG